MKLTEPQKRVLRALYEGDDIIFVETWGDRRSLPRGHPAWSISSLRRAGGLRFGPRRKTLEALERLGFLGRDSIDAFSFEYYLTPKGREVAKELLDADTR